MKWIFLMLALVPSVISDDTGRCLQYATDNATFYNSSYFEYVYEVANAVAESDEDSFPSMLEIAASITRAFFPADEIPSLPQDTWWGEGENGSVTEGEIRPFQINFTDDMITDLRSRLSNRKTFKEPLEDAANTYGLNSNFLNGLLDYWMNDYDFEARQDYLNSFPQYIVNVQGLDIHYIHIKAENSSKTTVPLLIIHGFPVTIFEYSLILPYLTDNTVEEFFEFEIIMPSIPGFAYSQATTKKGLAPYQVGIIFKNLMKILGHEKFYIFSGDVGQWIGSAMTILYEDDILGLHTNFAYSVMPETVAKFVIGGLFPSMVVEEQYEDRMYPLEDYFHTLLLEFGYYHIQATRPDTIGIGNTDSPSALAAWVIQEIMIHAEGGFSNVYAEDGNFYANYNTSVVNIFDSITIYWATQCFTTANRLYSERSAYLQDPLVYAIDRTPSKVPVTAIKFKDQIFYMPDSFLKDKYPNLLSSETLDYGGHYAGLENPETLATSIRSSIATMWMYNNGTSNILRC